MGFQLPPKFFWQERGLVVKCPPLEGDIGKPFIAIAGEGGG